MSASLRSRLLLVLAPFLLLAGLEGLARLVIGRREGQDGHDRYFRPLVDATGRLCTDAQGQALLANDPSMGSWVGRPGVGRRFFTAGKAPGIRRIFCLGASTTYGLGFAPEASFSRFLEARLRRLLATEDVEVVNTGISGYDSHDLPQVSAELLEFEPDLLIVYAGHNELKYPNLARVRHPWAAQLAGWLRGSALLRPWLGGTSTPELPGLIAAAPFLSAEDFARAQRGFRAALGELVARAAERGVPVLLCTPASNVRDKVPRLTVLEDLDPGLETAWRAFLLQTLGELGPGLAGETSGTSDPVRELAGESAVLEKLDELVGRRPRAALAQFLRGRVLWQQGRLDEAAAAFAASRSSDGLPERATPDLEETVRVVAEETGAILVDTARRIEAESQGGIPGFDLFVDYCHPTLRGHWILADEILRILVAAEILFPAAGLDWSREPAEDGLSFYVEELGIDLDRLVAAKVERAQSMIGEALAVADQRAAKLAIAEEMLRGALHMDPACARARLGLAVIHVLREERPAAVQEIEEAQRHDAEIVAEYARLIERSPLLVEAFSGQGIRVESGRFESGSEP